MRVIRKSEDENGRVLVLGTFDGVHIGHRALLRTAREYASAHGLPLRVYTFDRHPMEVVAPASAPKILTTLPEKIQRMSRLRVDEMQLVSFDREMAEMDPAAFLRMIRESIHVRAVAAGWNFTFGRGARGDAAMLKADGEANGYDVLIQEPTAREDGTPVSSSLIREELLAGRVEEADDLLRHPYTIGGTVREGKHAGRRIGFPTANVAYPVRKILPAYGVYTCLVETEEETYPGIVNIGVQPTMPSGQVTVEAHVLDGSPALYGQKVRLSLLEGMRREMKFDSPEALSRQIAMDREKALKLFGMA